MFLQKKLSYTKEEGKFIIDNLANLPIYEPTVNDVQSAIDLSIETQYTIYDSLILVAASISNCQEVYSEDLNDGQIVLGVKIVNPFK